MIDFNYTEEQNGIITFVNENGDAVKKYRLEQLEDYIKHKLLNLSYDWVEDEYGWLQEVEVYQPIAEYIDENFEQLTKDFYLSLNPTEHKAKNTPQKTLRQVR